VVVEGGALQCIYRYTARRRGARMGGGWRMATLVAAASVL